MRGACLRARSPDADDPAWDERDLPGASGAGRVVMLVGGLIG
jgi:hypothetical protein